MSAEPPIRLLLVCYHFPPMRTTGARRVARFAKYLPEDIEVEVLTVQDPPEGMGESGVGEPAGVVAHRAPTRKHLSREEIQRRVGGDSLAWKTANTALTYGLWVPDRQIAWLPGAVRAAREIVRKNPPDVVISSSPPHSVHLVALHVKRRAGSRWVADFRDPWTHNPTRHWPTPLHRRAERWLERKVLEGADLVLANTDGNRTKLIETFPRVDPARIVVLPNGFDPEQRKPLPKRRRGAGERFRILYIGHLYDGAEQVVDALEKALSDVADVASKVVFRFVGTQDRNIFQKMKPLEASGLVEFVPFKADDELESEFRDADGLLYVVPPSGGTWIPSKVYDYLAVARPILAILPDGDAKRLLIESEVAMVVDYGDSARIVRVILEFLETLRLDREWQAPSGFLARYDAKVQTQRLAVALREVVGHPTRS